LESALTHQVAFFFLGGQLIPQASTSPDLRRPAFQKFLKIAVFLCATNAPLAFSATKDIP
jgi:hypothetical protein